ncbi:hypothetical protein J4558_22815 [Leptolyngbya sp. 15MV]|nr:hypothetical protein J4558_22815 [Leptolyngbya sp. 15MV]
MPVSSADDAARIAIASLSEDERQGAVLYLDDAPLAAGEHRLGHTQVALAEPAWMAFLDLEPGANWAHACCYLLIGADGSLREIPESTPPFLRGEAPTLRVIARGNAPDWTLAAPYRPPA